jgi:hypothetical protein
MTTSLRGAAAAAALAACAAVPAARAADFSVSVFAASGNIQTGGPTNEDTQTSPTGAATSRSSTSTERYATASDSGTGNAASTGQGSAQAGGLRLLAESSASMVSTNGGAAGGLATGRVDASSNDSFTVLAGSCAVPALCGAGALGTLTFSIRFDASFGGGGTYASSTPGGGNGGWSVLGAWDASGGVFTGVDGTSWLRGDYRAVDQRGQPLVQTTNGGAGVQDFTVAFQFGTPISLQMRANAVSQSSTFFDYYASQDGNGGSSGGAAYVTDLAHTIAWNGIAAIRDASGATVLDFTALSADTGYDYARAYGVAVAPVPEPETWALMAAGLAGLGSIARRRQRREARA